MHPVMCDRRGLLSAEKGLENLNDSPAHLAVPIPAIYGPPMGGVNITDCLTGILPLFARVGSYASM